VVAYLRAHADGSPHRVDPDAYADLMRRAVYASHPEPFDVLGDHARRVRELATGMGTPRGLRVNGSRPAAANGDRPAATQSIPATTTERT